MIKVVDLVKRYKELLALDHFSFDLKEGEILGLLGPNGCGKTTLINCILGLLKYDKGEIEVFGEEFAPSSYKLKSMIGIVPQEIAVFENLTAYENIDYFCGLYVGDKVKRKRLVEEAIAFTGLEEHRKFTPKKLSGGLKRRLNIACGIAHKPKLIFMDEPTVAVDAQSRNFILDGIKQLNSEGTSVVYTTHYLEEAEELCERIVIMDRGKKVAEGSTFDLKEMVGIKEKIHLNLDADSNILDELEHSINSLGISKSKSEYIISYDKVGGNVEKLLAYLEVNKINYSELNVFKPTLNDVFLELTGKELRD